MIKLKIILNGWTEGFNAVRLAKAFCCLGIRLKTSKENVDLLLENKAVELFLNDDNIAREFINEAKACGVKTVLLRTLKQ